MAFSDYMHCERCVEEHARGEKLPEKHGYKAVYVSDDANPNVEVVCQRHLKALFAAEAALDAERAKVEAMQKERDLLFDALNLQMRATLLVPEAMDKVEAYRVVIAAAESQVRGECHRLEVGWNKAADDAAAERAKVAELRAVLERVEAVLDMGDEAYGAFPGGDPRDFTPDPECSTPAEREAHRQACIAYAGEPVELRPAHHWERTERGMLHVDEVMFGLGTYKLGPDALVGDICAILAKTGGGA